MNPEAVAAPNLHVTEIKAFVPTRDWALCKRFYQALGFTLASEGGGVAYFHRDHAAFLLCDDGSAALDGGFHMHLLVQDLDAWWQHVQATGVVEAFAEHGVHVGAIQQQPWRMRDFTLTDPSGVLWRIAQNTD